MKNYKKDLVDRIINLYNMYEKYMWRHEEVKLNILIQDNTISFYLYNEKEEIDEIIFNFSEKENKLYQYISIKILLEILKDVVVHVDDNEFHNRVLKPYLKLIVNDESILEIMKKLIDRQLSEIINDNTDLIKGLCDSVVNPLFYPNKFMKQLDDRIGMSRKLLRNGGIK